MIVQLTIKDLHVLKENILMAQSFFNECGLPGTFKIEAFLHNWSMLLEKNFGIIFALQKDEKVVGMLGGILSPDINSGELTATEAFWYVMPENRKTPESLKLLLVFEKWAIEIGAKKIIMAHLLSSMPERLGTFYERRGYKPVEIQYVKQV
jgi:GNAT superfamily N-acetyltransferase